MTISSRQPLLYFLLLILLLQWSSNQRIDGAAIYLRGNNYVDPFYNDLNYYDALANLEYDADPGDSEGRLRQQAPIDDGQVESDEDGAGQPLDLGLWESEIVDHEERGGNERVFIDDPNSTNRKRDTSESAPREQEQKASLTCHAQTPQQQACLDAAVKDTKDTIEHVTTLIKRMREHAVSIVKDINELEGDFLGACQDERPKSNCPNKPQVSKGKCKAPYGIGGADESGGAGGGYMVDGAGGFKRIYNDQENNYNNYGNGYNENNNEYNNNQNKVSYGNNYQNSNDNRNSNEKPYISDGFSGDQRGDNNNNNNNGGNEGSSNSPNVNTNTNSNPNSKGAPTKPRILMSEFAGGMPIRTDPSDLSHNEYVEQAQYAVHAWKNQIDECKRMLDDAMYNAVQQHQAAINAENPNIRPVIKLIKAPNEAEGMRQDYAAPPAAASITPVFNRNAKENNHNNANDINSVTNNNIIPSDNPSSLTKGQSLDALTLKVNDNKVTDDKQAITAADGPKSVRGDNSNDADTDVNDSTNNKRNEDAKKCRSDKASKKNRAVAPLLSVLQGMGF